MQQRDLNLIYILPGLVLLLNELFPCDAKDINECEANGMHSCSKNAACKNLHGSYKCTCEMGYSGDGFSCEGGSLLSELLQLMKLLL